MKKKNSKSIFLTILVPLLLVLIFEMMLLTGSMFMSGINRSLDQNATDILAKQVENRKGYLENLMLGSWSNLSALSNEINAATQQMLDSGEITWEELNHNSSAYMPLLTSIKDQLIDTLYEKQVTGIFVILNTDDLDSTQGQGAKTGVYIRDLDPTSAPSDRNSDLLLMRAPIDLVKKMDISTTSNWQPMFSMEEWKEAGFLYKPFQTAYQDREKIDIMEYGYWNANVYKMEGDDRSAISYSIPLILEDGRVYGVLGVDLLTDYIESLLPYEELQNDVQGQYLLSVSKETAWDNDQVEARSLIQSEGRIFRNTGSDMALSLEKDAKGGYLIEENAQEYYASVQPLNLYSSNGKYSDEQWQLLGILPKEQLFSASSQVRGTFLVAILLTFIVGIMCSLYVSRKLSNPVVKLSEEVEAKKEVGLPTFSKTGIYELDQLSTAISDLSQDILDTSTKFLRIMDMASVELGGYELWHHSEKVYVTENFLSLLGVRGVEASDVTKSMLLRICDELKKSYYDETADGNAIYQLISPDGKKRYIRMEITEEEKRQVGLVEDVTSTILEKIQLEHERDSDLLTGLYNRRAFYRQVEKLFECPEHLGCAAFLMMDMDNLKKVNDTFGHNWGDQYIIEAAKCLQDEISEHTLLARVSGDEFYLFFYGYQSKVEIRHAITELLRSIKQKVFCLPTGKEMQISLTGGVSWYPDDSTDLAKLMKYADFAMYQSKKTKKGKAEEFDVSSYNQELYRLECKKELHELIEKGLLFYYFQPIISAKSAKAFAYEALMRVNMKTLQAPSMVLAMAKEEGCLHEIERLTMFRATGSFSELLSKNLVEQDARLFVNSIASQYMTKEEFELFYETFAPIVRKMVIEITEEESLDDTALEVKRKALGRDMEFALDDYGSGYNGEMNLLKLSPKYIKVDMSIIRDIDTNIDKQTLFSNMVAYAHEREMFVIAEGIETSQELETVLRLGADLLQGYYLAKPLAIPGEISKESEEIILAYQKRTTQSDR